MSNIDTCVCLVLVPADESKPCVGPLRLSDGRSLDIHTETAHRLGYQEGDYVFREVIDVVEALNDHQAAG